MFTCEMKTLTKVCRNIDFLPKISSCNTRNSKSALIEN